MITKKVFPDARSVTLTGTVAAPVSVLKANIDESETAYTGMNITTDEVFAEDTTQSSSKTIDNDIPNAYVKEITVEIVPVQTGSGSPSPSNIRPITGFSVVDIDVSGTTYQFALGSECYGGKLTVNSDGTGTLVIDRKMIDMGSMEWTRFLQPGIGYYFRSIKIYTLIEKPGAGEVSTAISSVYPVNDVGNLQNGHFMVETNGRVDIMDNDYSDATTFTTSVTGQSFVYPLAEPITYNLTQLQTIQLIVGTNTITCNTGDIKSIKYLSSSVVTTIPFPASIGNIYSGTIEVYENGNAIISANDKVVAVPAPKIYLHEGSNTLTVDTGNITLLAYHFYASNICHARATFPIGGSVFTDEDFSADAGIRISSYMNSDTNMRFGTAFSKEVQFEFVKSSKTEHFDWNQEFKLEFGTEVNGVTDWTTIGYFMNNTPVDYRNSTVLSITANDRMRSFEKSADDFVKYITYTVLTKAGASGYTFSDFYNDLLYYVGVEKEDGDELPIVMERNFYAYRNLFLRYIEPKETTLKEVLCWFAEINGCYARITNEGKVQLFWFSDCTEANAVPVDNIFQSTVTDIYKAETFVYEWQDVENNIWDDVGQYLWGYFDKAEANYKILATQSYDSAYHTANIYPEKYGSKDNLYTIVDNPFFISPCDGITVEQYSEVYEEEQAILHAINDRISLFESNYTTDIVAVGNYLAEAGDIITAEISTGELIHFPIYNLMFVWKGGCECEYVTTGSVNRDDDLDIAERINSKTATLRDILALQSAVDDNAEEIESAKDDIASNAAGIASNSSQIGVINETLAKVGTVVTGTNKTSLTVPSGSWTDISDMELTAGTWIINGHARFTSSFDQATGIELRTSGHVQQSIVRGTGLNGGGLSTTYITTVLEEESPKEFHLGVTQASGSDKTANYVLLIAVRIA